MVIAYYYVAFDGKTPAGHGMFTKQQVLKSKKNRIESSKKYNPYTAKQIREKDWFMEYLNTHEFYGSAGMIIDENGRLVIRWTRTPNRWGPQWKDYRRPF